MIVYNVHVITFGYFSGLKVDYNNSFYRESLYFPLITSSISLRQL